ncbi:MAG: DUF1330 domain-containing protein [Pseudohongiella sp.]|jgi:uncharacterized protein (DUF1330 family)|nr:DUF1330 domain-containing protein [Pseudohongiella sp.]
MKKTIAYLIIFALGIGFGASLTIAGAAENADKPAYLIVSSDRLPGADYGPYSRAAGPLAREAGLEMVATAQPPLVLEGNWPYKNIALEVYPSMDALKEFWYSEGYQTAKKLREGLSTVNFIVAVEAD